MNSKWPIFRVIKLGTPDLKNTNDFRRALKENGFKGCEEPHDDDILIDPVFTVADHETELSLVIASISQLGFQDGTSLEQAYRTADVFGFEALPEEAGPQLRLQYKDQPIGERLIVCVKPAIGLVNFPLFDVEHDKSGLWLRGYHMYSRNMLGSDARLVFKHQ